jgi:hypothetical protein
LMLSRYRCEHAWYTIYKLTGPSETSLLRSISNANGATSTIAAARLADNSTAKSGFLFGDLHHASSNWATNCTSQRRQLLAHVSSGSGVRTNPLARRVLRLLVG